VSDKGLLGARFSLAPLPAFFSIILRFFLSGPVKKVSSQIPLTLPPFLVGPSPFSMMNCELGRKSAFSFSSGAPSGYAPSLRRSSSISSTSTAASLPFSPISTPRLLAPPPPPLQRSGRRSGPLSVPPVGGTFVLPPPRPLQDFPFFTLVTRRKVDFITFFRSSLCASSSFFWSRPAARRRDG